MQWAESPPIPGPLSCCIPCPHSGLAFGRSLNTTRPGPCAEDHLSCMGSCLLICREGFCLLVSPDCMTGDLLKGGLRGKKAPFQHNFEARGFCRAGWGFPVGVYLEGLRAHAARTHLLVNLGAASPSLCWRPFLTLPAHSGLIVFP